MNKILASIFILLSAHQALGYKFNVYNQTRGNVSFGGSPGGSITVYIYTVAGPRYDVTIPVGESRSVDTVGWCLSKVEAYGNDGAVSGVDRAVVDVPWNLIGSCQGRDIYVKQVNFRYIAPQGPQQIGGGTQVVVGGQSVQFDPGKLSIEIAGM